MVSPLMSRCDSGETTIFFVVGAKTMKDLSKTIIILSLLATIVAVFYIYVAYGQQPQSQIQIVVVNERFEYLGRFNAGSEYKLFLDPNFKHKTDRVCITVFNGNYSKTYFYSNPDVMNIQIPEEVGKYYVAVAYMKGQEIVYLNHYYFISDKITIKLG